MKKYEVDPTATKDGKLMENDIVLFRYADALLMKSEAKVRNGSFPKTAGRWGRLGSWARLCSPRGMCRWS